MRPGAQRTFLLDAKLRTGVRWPELAQRLGVNVRTIIAWRADESTISLRAARQLQRWTKRPLPQGATILAPYWHTREAGRKGGFAVLKKYGRIGGDPEYRKQRWQRWWEAIGKFQKHPLLSKLKPILYPKKSIKLSEWVGLVLGDGGISNYQVIVTLNRFDDAQYISFVSKLEKRLFGVKPSLYSNPNDRVTDIVISRRALVNFCIRKLGLVVGNKIRQRVDIPQWIRAEPSYEIACVRGLIDTDGSIFTHRYRVNGKWYAYKKLQFTSHSRPLLESVRAILSKHGIRCRVARGTDVFIDGIDDMRRYFSIIGSHNPKHLKRYGY